MTRFLNQQSIDMIRNTAKAFGIVVICGLSLSVSVSAQIISQSPQPDIIMPEDDEALKIQTIKPRQEVGRSDRHVKIPKAGAFLFASFDRDQNYQIDRAEVQVGINIAFGRADKDGSGLLSLVELEAWRVKALGSENATPTNFAFAPNFARTVSPQQFETVLMKLFDKHDLNDQGEVDGKIGMPDLLKTYTPPRRRDNRAPRSREDRQQDERTRRLGWFD